MDLSKISCILLIGFLPALTFIIYFEGRQYDPALIRFEPSVSEESKISSYLPNEISGYHRTGSIRSYTKENLYEYVNGHAEYFISAGFAGLAVGEYGEPRSAGTGPDVVVDIYDMGNSIQAFGVLSDESGGRLSDLQDGLTGFRTPQGINFVKGRYYVRMSIFNEKVPSDIFSDRIAGAIGTGTDPFPEFARLPDIGDVATTRFIKESYRGLDFVNNVIEREYIKNGESVYVFVTTGKAREISNLSASFVNYFRRSDIEYIENKKPGGKVYTVKDPYEGDWVMISAADALFGIYGAFDDKMIDAILTGSPDR